MIFIYLIKIWHLLATNVCDMRAARVERTAAGRVDQRWWAAGATITHTLIAELGQRVDQKPGIGMQRMCKDPLCGRFFNNLTGIHDANPVSDVGMYAHIVRDHDN